MQGLIDSQKAEDLLRSVEKDEQVLDCQEVRKKVIVPNSICATDSGVGGNPRPFRPRSRRVDFR